MGKNAPAFTVASLAMIMKVRPQTLARLVPARSPGSPKFAVAHFKRRINAELEEWRVGIAQLRDALTRRQAAFFVLGLDCLGAAALANLFFLILNFREEIDDAAGVLFEVGRFAICGSFQDGTGHAIASRHVGRWILIR